MFRYIGSLRLLFLPTLRLRYISVAIIYKDFQYVSDMRLNCTDGRV